MMKKYIYGVLITMLFLFSAFSVDASSGRLKKDSIKTCNGIRYGQHSDDNHWHEAQRNSDGS